MRRLSRLLGVLVLTLLVLEGALRLLAGLSPPGRLARTRFDPSLGWEPVPGAAGPVRIDELGLRGEAVPSPKAEGELRILALGDEATLGPGLAEESLYPALLARRLRGRGATVRALNGGVEGYATDQQLLRLRRLGPRVEPDLVLLAGRRTDPWRASRADFYGHPKPLFERRPEGGLAPGNVPLAPGGGLPWFRRSHLLRLLAGPEEPIFAAAGVRLPAEWAPYLRPEPPEVAAWWERLGGLLALMEAETRRLGARLLAFPLPDRIQIRGEDAHLLLDRWGIDLERSWHIDQPTARFLEVGRREGLTCLDTLAAFREAARRGADLLQPGAGGLTPAGHELVARLLEEKLLELGWRGLKRRP